MGGGWRKILDVFPETPPILCLEMGCLLLTRNSQSKLDLSMSVKNTLGSTSSRQRFEWFLLLVFGFSNSGSANHMQIFILVCQVLRRLSYFPNLENCSLHIIQGPTIHTAKMLAEWMHLLVSERLNEKAVLAYSQYEFKQIAIP